MVIPVLYGEGMKQPPQTARRTSATGQPLFAVRAPRSVHARLRAASVADGLTVAQELTRLLDLRDAFELESRPAHPLAVPASPSAVLR